MAPNWYLLHTNPRKEALVAGQLQAYDVEVFYPVITRDRGYGRGMAEEAFFPSYLFFHADLMSSQVPNLRHLPGVRTLVHFDHQAAIVPESVIDHLRQRLATDAAGHGTAPSPYRPNQRVRVRSGPFAGLDALFQRELKGAERVQVLLEGLGSLTRVQLDAALLESA